MKGFRTLAAGFAMAVLPVAVTYLAGVDWTQYVGPNVALVISGVVTIALRFVTSTAVGSKS